MRHAITHGVGVQTLLRASGLALLVFTLSACGGFGPPVTKTYTMEAGGKTGDLHLRFSKGQTVENIVVTVGDAKVVDGANASKIVIRGVRAGATALRVQTFGTQTEHTDQTLTVKVRAGQSNSVVLRQPTSGGGSTLLILAGVVAALGAVLLFVVAL